MSPTHSDSYQCIGHSYKRLWKLVEALGNVVWYGASTAGLPESGTGHLRANLLEEEQRVRSILVYRL